MRAEQKDDVVEDLRDGPREDERESQDDAREGHPDGSHVGLPHQQVEKNEDRMDDNADEVFERLGDVLAVLEGRRQVATVHEHAIDRLLLIYLFERVVVVI